MSAPVTERTRAATRARAATTIPAQRSAPGGAVRGKDRGAAGKAYARRDDRLRRLVGGRPARTATAPGRTQFVLLVMVLLAIGLVATLWLSTAASADSYKLQDARTDARNLQEQSERLHREVAAMDAAPELARKASELGMVPVQDPARIVVGPDGSTTVVGEPKVAFKPAPVLPPAPPAPPAAPPAAATPAAGTPVVPPANGAVPAPAVQGDAPTGGAVGTGA
ncbi:hypothetical protein [Pseudonocardia sp. GCM10023141]|uniref:hypothetical protein n=1 Tax=Pseudonocardia sp. GCM10023141 TaxID=3252653 RepID=UPI003611D1D3